MSGLLNLCFPIRFDWETAQMVDFDEALLESIVFLEHFADLPDPRQLIKVV